jgi:acyl-CoA thioesterase I
VTRNPPALVVRGSLTLGALALAALAAAQAPAAAPAAPAFPGQYAPPPAERKFPAWPKGCARFEGEEKVSCLDVVASDFGGFYRYAAANAALAAPKPGEERVVFFGDSITDNWSKPEYGGFFPGKPYVNRGIGGQTTPQMLVRFRQDVIALKPAVVVILAGTNDIAGNTGPSTIEMIEDNLASMAELAKANGIAVVLSSVLPVYDYPWRPGLEPAPKILALNKWMKEYASTHGAVYLDYHTPMADERQGMKADLASDGVHPNEACYRIMAPLAEKAIAEALGRKGR